MATPQEKMKAKLRTLGIPYKKIDVYGKQIVITTVSLSAANKWRSALSPRVAKYRGTTQAVERTKKNRGTVLRPTTTRVYHVFFRV